MRGYKWLLIGGSIMFLAAIFSLFFAQPYRVSATGPICDLSNCAYIDTSIADFKKGGFSFTGMQNTGDGAVQLLPVGLTDQWITDTYRLPDKRRELSAVIYNDNIYVIGGWDAQSGTNPHGEVFQAATTNTGALASAWTTPTVMPGGRAGASSVISPTANGAYLYVLGGIYDRFQNITSTIYLNSISPNGTLGSWTTLVQQMPTYAPLGELQYYQAIVRGGYLYVMGGVDSSGNQLYPNIERAAINPDGTLGNWTADTPGLKSRGNFAAATWHNPTSGSDWLYLLGGTTVNGSVDGDPQVDYASINNAGGTINAFSSSNSALPYGYWAHGAVQSNGVLYVTGGNPGGSNTAVTNTVQSALIDPSGQLHDFGLGNNWIPSNPLPEGRKSHANVINSVGEVYVIGGYGDSTESVKGSDTVYHGSTRGFGAYYAPSGEYDSAIINLVNQRDFSSIVVTTTLTDTAHTFLSIQYRVGNTDAAVQGAGWTTLAPAINSGISARTTYPLASVSASRIQYRALFTTTLNNLTPILEAVQINYPPPPTPTPTATNTPNPQTLPDFTIYGIQAPVTNSVAMSQTFAIRVANIGGGAFRPVARAGATPVASQSTNWASLSLPAIRNKTLAQIIGPNKPNGFFAWVELYIDRGIPTGITDLGNCMNQSGQPVVPPYVYSGDLPLGSYKDYSITCWLNTTSTHTFYAQVDTCDNPSICTPYGYVLERNESNNIFGPVSSGSIIPPVSGGMFLPNIQKNP